MAETNIMSAEFDDVGGSMDHIGSSLRVNTGVQCRTAFPGENVLTQMKTPSLGSLLAA